MRYISTLHDIFRQHTPTHTLYYTPFFPIYRGEYAKTPFFEVDIYLLHTRALHALITRHFFRNIGEYTPTRHFFELHYNIQKSPVFCPGLFL